MPSVIWDKNVVEEYPQSQDCMELYDGDELSDDESLNDALSNTYVLQSAIGQTLRDLKNVVDWMNKIQHSGYFELEEAGANCQYVKRISDNLEDLINTNVRDLLNNYEENED